MEDTERADLEERGQVVYAMGRYFQLRSSAKGWVKGWVKARDNC